MACIELCGGVHTALRHERHRSLSRYGSSASRMSLMLIFGSLVRTGHKFVLYYTRSANVIVPQKHRS